MTDSVMAKYVAHTLSLQCKLQQKHIKKDPVPAAEVASESTDVAAESAAAEPVASPVIASVAAVPLFALMIRKIHLRVLVQRSCLRLSLCLTLLPGHWRLGSLISALGLVMYCQGPPALLVRMYMSARMY